MSQLDLIVMKAVNLHEIDSPYVCLRLRQPGYPIPEWSCTRVAKNGQWNQQFVFQLPDPPYQLEVALYCARYNCLAGQNLANVDQMTAGTPAQFQVEMKVFDKDAPHPTQQWKKAHKNLPCVVQLIGCVNPLGHVCNLESILASVKPLPALPAPPAPATSGAPKPSAETNKKTAKSGSPMTHPPKSTTSISGAPKSAPKAPTSQNTTISGAPRPSMTAMGPSSGAPPSSAPPQIPKPGKSAALPSKPAPANGPSFGAKPLARRSSEGSSIPKPNMTANLTNSPPPQSAQPNLPSQIHRQPLGPKYTNVPKTNPPLSPPKPVPPPTSFISSKASYYDP